MVAPEDSQPQVDAGTPEGAPEETTAPQDAAAAPQADTPATDASGDEQAPQGAAPAGDAAPDAAADQAPAPQDAPTEADVPAGEVASVDADAPAAEDAPASADAPAAEAPADGEQAAAGQQAAEGEQAAGGEQSQGGEDGAKKRRRSRGRRSGRGGGPGGRRRFAWDEVFLRQRLELLRAMDPDPEAIAWAVDTAGRFEVADILAGEGSSGREFGRRAYGAQPETEDQAAWIVLAAVRARDIVPIARVAVSTTDDQRQQVRDAIELLGIARVNPALQGDRPPQQVFAERARRVDVTVEGGEAQKAAWALLALARPQDVKYAASPRPSGQGRRPGGPGRPGDRDGGERRGRGRREPGIPGGVFSVGEAGIGSELGEKLRAALAQAEGQQGGDQDQQQG